MDIPDIHCRRNVVTAVTWRILAEIFRRQQERCDLRILELHPSGGTYDCVALFAPAGDDPFGCTLLHMHIPANHLHFLGSWGLVRPHKLSLQSGFNYVTRFLSMEEPAQIIEAIEAQVGLPVAPERLPRTTPPVLTMRVMAGLAECFMLDRRTLNVRCAWDDGGWGAAIREWVRVVPGMEAAFELKNWRDQMRRVSRVWRFEIMETKRWLIFDIGAGIAYSPEGSLALIDAYQKGERRIEPLIQQLLKWL